MSILIDLRTCSKEQIDKLNNDLNVIVEISKIKDYQKKKQYIPPLQYHLQPFRSIQNLVFVPFSYGISEGYKPMMHNKLSQPYIFKGQLRDEQKVVRNEVIEHLNKKNTIIISTHVGFGKSIIATYFAYKIQMKTIIVVNRITLIHQWIEVLNTFLHNPKIQFIKPQEIIDWDCDFFIINAMNIVKMGYMPEIGLVIVDEVHLIVSKVISECFQYFTPTYFIGLSATPYRTDGLDTLLDLYFGKERVHRKLNRKHIVYKVNTGFKPEIKKQKNGKVDWNDILNQQATDVNRNQLIVSIVSSHLQDKKFLILCKRVDHIKLLEQEFLKKGITTQTLHGDKQPTQEIKQVLIGTIQKVGTGFDAPYLNALIVASDLEAYFIQYLGRIFRKRNTIPFVFDFVDNDTILKSHWNTRKDVYIEHGGIISTYKET